MASVYAQIEQKLLKAFSPTHLEVKDESYMHSSGPQAESHFKVTIVTSSFDGKRLLQRHREVNKVLANELRDRIHALALHTYTDSEWQNLSNQIPESPRCMGGSKLVD
ncbi:BolA family protein [Aliidiomarina sanyensis]|uniref:DNA-binding transcriptional regulator BolA n=1 Tax=Aliidiomarina sanyensis TaxID=1249555 RepID=A0A432WDI3_9GAMM|nr:BolA/IbaG family iron-sulfur metabolism protein [Aliidiomarina sanyensis]RUO30458.1 transcriptional regulator [Aliidiomarina sanyensis]